jgi:hypothetical protein
MLGRQEGPSVDDQYVSLKQLAKELGMDRSHARKYVLNLGVTPGKRRTPESGGQLTLTVSTQEAEFVRRTRAEQGFLDSQKPVTSETGVFYAIQLVPELVPGRVKLGFADTVEVRLAQHRTSAPTARLLRSWPCRRSWERTAIDALSAVGGHLVLNEVFEFEDIDALVTRGDEFFGLLPDPQSRTPLAQSSPHRQREKATEQSTAPDKPRMA